MQQLLIGGIEGQFKTGKTCNTCAHRERWECGSKIIQYCGKITSNRTSNGKKKIRCKDEACFYYEGRIGR